MFFSVFGLFLDQNGVSMDKIGIIDGLIEGVGYFIKVLSGLLSDMIGKRQLLFAVGAFFSTCSKFLVLLSCIFAGGLVKLAVLSRVFDRFGNGLQASTRDALVGDYAPPQVRGLCFGIRQSMGTLGSVLGTLIVARLVWWCSDSLHFVFLIAGIPAALALFMIIFLVKDPGRTFVNRSSTVAKGRFRLTHVTQLSAPYWRLMLVVGTFMLCRFSESFLMLYVKKGFHVDMAATTYVMLSYNSTAVLSSYVAGRLLSRFSSVSILCVGIIFTLTSNIIMFFAPNYSIFLLGILFWGGQIGLMQSIFCSEISAFVAPELRGTGFGLFYFIMALSLLAANYIGGHLMECWLPSIFVYSGAVSCLSLLPLFFVLNRRVQV
jgi:MFS family permease